jgi:hypothetical protein
MDDRTLESRPPADLVHEATKRIRLVMDLLVTANAEVSETFAQAIVSKNVLRCRKIEVDLDAVSGMLDSE